MSAIETRAIARPPATIAVMSSSDTRGIPNEGRPCGSGPTTGRPVEAASPKMATTTVGSDRRDEHAGDSRCELPEPDDDRDGTEPDRERGRDGLARGDALDERAGRADDAFRIDREAEQLGKLTDEDRQGDPVEVADPDRLREEVREEAEPKHAECDAEGPRDEGEAGGEVGGPGRIAERERSDRRGDERGER